jgi:hypothetical protein
MRKLRIALAATAALTMLLTGLPQGQAEETSLPPLDITKLPWQPTPDLTNLDNWRTYNAYNVVHFVAEQLPNRQPNDQTSDDPLGEPNPRCRVLGDTVNGNCTYNHQLEYLQWFEQAYGELLADFGVTFRTYQFTSPGSGPATFGTNAGRAFNKFAIVPGADHPEDIVMIGSHFDGVDGSPFAAWDSTAGSGTMLRTAKMLVDYWKATGTRPSKTYIFAAWDAEEAGGVGSKFYVGSKSNRSAETGGLPKDPDVVMTSYINHDPCGGHYPAFYRGSPASRNPLVEKTGFIPMNIALHAPSGTAEERARMTAFNNSMRPLINQLFNQIDDTLPFTGLDQEPGIIPVFLSTQEAAALGSEALEQESVLKVTTRGLMLFTTDAEDFHNWIPTLNPYPDNVGPHALSTDPQDLGWGPDGLWVYHSPHDNFQSLVAQTSADQTGLTYSKGLAMSWEFCAAFAAWTMLQPSQGGAQVANTAPVAFFETPEPNRNGGTHTFSAAGSYRYVDAETRELDPTLEYRWTFSDGTTAEGLTVTKTFPTTGQNRAYRATLTVFDPETEQTDTMTMKIGTGTL